jgi:hypothetical protein
MARSRTGPTVETARLAQKPEKLTPSKPGMKAPRNAPMTPTMRLVTRSCLRSTTCSAIRKDPDHDCSNNRHAIHCDLLPCSERDGRLDVPIWHTGGAIAKSKLLQPRHFTFTANRSRVPPGYVLAENKSPIVRPVREGPASENKVIRPLSPLLTGEVKGVVCEVICVARCLHSESVRRART